MSTPIIDAAWPDAVERQPAPSATPEALAESLAAATAEREQVTACIDDALREVVVTYLPALREAVAAEQLAREHLLAAVEADGPAAYPPRARSRTAHGITWGYRLAADAIVIDDHARSVALARKRLSAADAEAIIRTEPRILIDALRGWTDAQLGTIEARREPGTDQPYVRGAAGDVDRLVRAISTQALRAAGGEA